MMGDPLPRESADMQDLLEWTREGEDQTLKLGWRLYGLR
jgi:hypothetical protein